MRVLKKKSAEFLERQLINNSYTTIMLDKIENDIDHATEYLEAGNRAMVLMYYKRAVESAGYLPRQMNCYVYQYRRVREKLEILAGMIRKELDQNG